MKYFIVLFTSILLSQISFGQNEDNVTLIRVQKEIGNGNFQKALEQLKKMTPEGKKSDFYLTFKANCYENLYKYDSAGIFYRQLYKRNNSMDVMKKIADMDEFGENKEVYLKIIDSIQSTGKAKAIVQNLYLSNEGGKYIGIIITLPNNVGCTLATFKLPNFIIKCLAISDLKLETNKQTGNQEYFFSGNYFVSFEEEYAPCNKDVPPAVCSIRSDENYNEMKFTVFNYECVINKQTGEKKIREAAKPSNLNFTKISSFSLPK
jgi:hypothetical protein